MSLGDSYTTGKNVYTDSTGTSYSYFVITWSGTQSVEDNSTTITSSVTFYTGPSSGPISSWGRTINNVTLTIAGTKVVDESPGVWKNSGTSWTGTSKIVIHEDDGTKNITISFSATLSSGTPNPLTLSKSVDLDTIPRGAKLSSDKTIVTPTDPVVNFTLSPAFTTWYYTIDRKVSNKDWELKWYDGTETGTYIPYNYFDDNYNDIITRAGTDGSYSVQYRCKTFSGTSEGSTQIGTEDILTINTYYAGEPMPMSLYQNGSSIGVSFLTEVNQPGFWVAGQGPITVSTQAFTLDDGNSYYILGIWD